MPDDYVTLKLPKELTDKIDKIVKANLFGYKNRGEFVKESVRLRLIEFEKLVKIREGL